MQYGLKVVIKAVVIIVALGLLLVTLNAFSAQGYATVTAKGVVMNPVTGEFVSGATVRLGESSRYPATSLYTAKSDDQGRFTIESIVPGKYRVTLEKEGFVFPRAFAEDDSPLLGREVMVADGAMTSNLIRLPLIRSARISGRVVDQKGSPVGPVWVTALEKGYGPQGKSELLAVRSAVANDEGEYAITGLRPGEYFLRVGSFVKFKDGVRSEGGGPVIPRSYYPGATTQDAAVSVKLGEGMIAGALDIKVIPAPVFSIRMKLESASDLSILQFRVGDFYDSSVVDGADGGVYIVRNLPPGDYDIDIDFLNGHTHRIHATVVDRDLDLKTISVDSEVSIPGRVVVRNGKEPPMSIRLDPIFGLRSRTEHVGKDGTFIFERVSPGEYAVEGVSREFYVRSVRYGGLDIPGKLVIDGTPSGPLEIVLDGPPASVEGIVQDARGEPVAFGRVVLVPEATRRANPKLFLTAITDEEGRFSIENATPGDYSAMAFRYMPRNAYRSMEFLEPFLHRAFVVELSGGGKNTLRIRVVEMPSMQ